VATVVVAVWENDIDRARAHCVLNRDAALRYVPAVDDTLVEPGAGEHAPAV
jgi:aerobic C4-dicarboxylate transport protein